jgi:putative ABC transport system substrate-binding protein
VKWCCVVVVLLLVCRGWFTSDTRAADRARPAHIGVLTASWGPTPQVMGLRDGLLKLGYREHEDFELGVRFTQGRVAALPAAARQLVQYGVDLIVADSDESAMAVQQATSRIPIVFTSVADPVGLGLIQSFARPGSNITGVSDLELELAPKRLEVFQSLVPGLRRVLFPYDATHVPGQAAAKSYREAAQRLGLELIERPLYSQQEAWAVLAQLHKGEVDGILAPPGPALNIHGFILEVAAQQAIPTMFGIMLQEGEHSVLASYGPDIYKTGLQTARLVDKVLKGANPADIPVEVNSNIEFVINLRVAQALGFRISPEMLYQANRLLR